MELHELADDTVSAEHLRNGQDEVGGGNTLLKSAGQLEADHLWDEHVVRLSEGDGLRLNASDAPAENAEAVDHGGVTVRAHQRIRHRDVVLDEHALRQVLKVNLMDDAGGGRDDREVIEGLLAPLQELVALAVPLELPLRVELERRRRSEGVHLDGVVYDQVGRYQRVDLARVPPDVLHRAPHRRQVHDRGNARKVLHNHPRR